MNQSATDNGDSKTTKTFRKKWSKEEDEAIIDFYHAQKVLDSWSNVSEDFWERLSLHLNVILKVSQCKSAANIRKHVLHVLQKKYHNPASAKDGHENESSHLVEQLESSVHSLSTDHLMKLSQILFKEIADRKGFAHYSEDFVESFFSSSELLKNSGRSDVIYKLTNVIANRRMDVNKMPFGLMEYQVDFFSATNVHQIRIAPDYRMWLKGMVAQFGRKFLAAFRGPMWDGRGAEERGNPCKAQVNVCAPGSASLLPARKRPTESDETAQASKKKKSDTFSMPVLDHEYW